jgi:hypothetical protein
MDLAITRFHIRSFSIMKIKIILLLFGIIIFTSIMKDRLPNPGEIEKALYLEPRQKETTVAPFTVQKKELTFTIEPLYEYELYGLVVSEYNTKSLFDLYHEEWKDDLNIKDICVIWGDNLKDDNFRKLTYHHGSWTCYVSAKNRNIWKNFHANQLSNNHLLVDEGHLKNIIMQAKRGDQVFLSGYLAKYSRDDGFKRSSSTSRDDRGCEVIFVKQFEILKKNNSVWRMLNTGAIWALCAFIVFNIFVFFAVPFGKT